MLRRFRLTGRREARKGYGIEGWVQARSSVKANRSQIECNDSEELVEVESFVCR